MAKVEKTQAEFTLAAPDSKEVVVAGTFNDWSTTAHPMKKDSKGAWKRKVGLEPGVYEYKFIVDGEWIADPKCRKTTVNEYGTHNSVLTVKAARGTK